MHMQVNNFPRDRWPGQQPQAIHIFPKITGQKTASQADGLQRVLTEAHDEYREKTYAEEYRSAYSLAKTATHIGHMMSIAFGFAFIFSTAYLLLFGKELAAIAWPDDWLQILAAGLITVAILVFLVEGVKASAFNSLCRSQLKSRFGLLPYFVPLLIAGSLAACSVFFSVQGALQVAEMHTFIPDSEKVDITSIWSSTDGSISAIDDKIRKLELGHAPYGYPYGWTDKKKTHHLNKKGNREKAKLEAEKAKLMAARDTRLDDGRNFNTKKETAAEIDRQLYGYTGAGLSILAELIILLSIAYQHRYKFKANQEGELGIALHLPSLVSHQAPHGIGFQQPQAAPAMQQGEPSKIGFQMAGQTVKTAKTATVSRHSDGYRITCQQCGTVAVMRSPRAKYCCEECRKEAYQERTGNTITA